jgi:crotonobetainyl-CoA:carnitine CoA-transferase CaiB-like acyl-CoA transferase
VLEGIKILSFTHYLQRPSATQILADFEADVIKIETTRGGYERHWSGAEAYLNGDSIFFLLAGRNQRSLSIDLRAEEGKEVIRRMLPETDVVIENFRPGAMERLGFGYEAISEANPRIVYCSLSGYEPTGPYQKRPGQDLLIQATSGLAMQNGRKGDPPTLVGTAVVDQHAAVLGALGVLAALLEHTSTGKGKKVDSNLLSAALDLQIEPFNYYLNGAQLYERSASGISSRFHQSPYDIFETADGYICLSLTTTEALAEALNDESFRGYTSEDLFGKREEINSRIAKHMREKTTNHWYEVFDEAGVWYAPVNDYADIEDDPQLAANGSILTFEHARAGTVRLLFHPVRYDEETLPLRRIPPSTRRTHRGDSLRSRLRRRGYIQPGRSWRRPRCGACETRVSTL